MFVVLIHFVKHENVNEYIDVMMVEMLFGLEIVNDFPRLYNIDIQCLDRWKIAYDF